MRHRTKLLVYNYVETPTESLGELVRQTEAFLTSNAPVFRVPLAMLLPAARLAQSFVGTKSPVHPVRVKKAAMSTYIVPLVLRRFGSSFAIAS